MVFATDTVIASPPPPPHLSDGGTTYLRFSDKGGPGGRQIFRNLEEPKFALQIFIGRGI